MNEIVVERGVQRKSEGAIRQMTEILDTDLLCVQSREGEVGARSQVVEGGAGKTLKRKILS